VEVTSDNDNKKGHDEGLDAYGDKTEARWNKIARATRRRAPDNRPNAGAKMHADDGGEHRF
jgi:hypothetical protein